MWQCDLREQNGGRGCANDVENKCLDYFEVIFTPGGPKEVS